MKIKDQTEGYVGIGKQTTKGTSVMPTRFFKYTSIKFNHNMSVKEIDNEGGGSNVPAYISQVIKTGHKPDVEVGFNAQPSSLAEMLAFLLGKDVKTGAGDPYTHTITPERNVSYSPLPWLTTEQRVGGSASDDIIERFYDALIGEIKIEFSAGDVVKGTVKASAISAYSDSSWAPSSDAYEPGNRFVFSDGIFTLDNLICNGTAASRIQSGSIEITNTLKADDIAGDSPKRIDIVPSFLKIKLSLTVYAEGEDTDKFYRKINYGSAAGTNIGNTLFRSSTNAFKVKFNRGDTPERSIEIIIPAVDFTANVIDRSGSGGITVMAIEGNAIKGSGDIISVTAINGDAAAYV